MDYSPPGSSVHAILQARILRWVAIPFSRGSSQPRDRTYVYCLAGRFLTTEPPVKPCPASLGIRKCKSKGQWDIAYAIVFSVLHYLPGVCSNSCPLSPCCYLTTSSSVTPFSLNIIKNSTKNKCWGEYGEKRTLVHCRWKCKLVQPLWKTVWRFLKNLK